MSREEIIKDRIRRALNRAFKPFHGQRYTEEVAKAASQRALRVLKHASRLGGIMPDVSDEDVN